MFKICVDSFQCVSNIHIEHPACLPYCFTKRMLRGPVRAPRRTFPEATKKITRMTNCAPFGAIASAFSGRAPSPKPQRPPSHPQGEPIIQVDGPPPSPSAEWNRMYGGMSVPAGGPQDGQTNSFFLDNQPTEEQPAGSDVESNSTWQRCSPTTREDEAPLRNRAIRSARPSSLAI